MKIWISYKDHIWFLWFHARIVLRNRVWSVWNHIWSLYEIKEISTREVKFNEQRSKVIRETITQALTPWTRLAFHKTDLHLDLFLILWKVICLIGNFHRFVSYRTTNFISIIDHASIASFAFGVTVLKQNYKTLINLYHIRSVFIIHAQKIFSYLTWK